MEKFNLDEYFANPSRKIVTRDGRKARILCTDARGSYPIIALIESLDGTEEIPGSFSRYGAYLISDTRYNDLFFAPREGWMNILDDGDDIRMGSIIYDSKEEAEKLARINKSCVATIKVSWEE